MGGLGGCERRAGAQAGEAHTDLMTVLPLLSESVVGGSLSRQAGDGQQQLSVVWATTTSGWAAVGRPRRVAWLVRYGRSVGR